MLLSDKLYSRTCVDAVAAISPFIRVIPVGLMEQMDNYPVMLSS